MMAVIGVVFTLPVIIIPKILAPHKPNPIKNLPFESGQVPLGGGKMHFMMQYYAYLLMLVVFDVMAVFLYACAAAYRPLALGVSSGWMITLVLGMFSVPIGVALYMSWVREQR